MTESEGETPPPDDTPSSPESKSHSPEHVIVLSHGLWGNAQHMKSIETMLQDKLGKEHEILTLRSNVNSGNLTYEGVDVCGERLFQEIERVVKANPSLKFFSIIGYSLGGLIARYAVGRLHACHFLGLIPLTFVTMATPHLGVVAMGKSAFMEWSASTFLGRSGEQMTLSDPEHLLESMTKPTSHFWLGLKCFKKRFVFGDLFNDRTVPYPTACITNSVPLQATKREDLTPPSPRYPHVAFVQDSHEDSPHQRSVNSVSDHHGPHRKVPHLSGASTAAAAGIGVVLSPVILATLPLATIYLTSMAAWKKFTQATPPDTSSLVAGYKPAEGEEEQSGTAVGSGELAEQTERMRANLDGLMWCRVTCSLPGPNAHSHMVVRREWFNASGMDIIEFLADHFEVA